jgi:hypothetical protein
MMLSMATCTITLVLFWPGSGVGTINFWYVGRTRTWDGGLASPSTHLAAACLVRLVPTVVLEVAPLADRDADSVGAGELRGRAGGQGEGQALGGRAAGEVSAHLPAVLACAALCLP